MSLSNMVDWLESQGKVMGKDFDIDSTCTMGNTLLTLKNKKGGNCTFPLKHQLPIEFQK